MIFTVAGNADTWWLWRLNAPIWIKVIDNNLDIDFQVQFECLAIKRVRMCKFIRDDVLSVHGVETMEYNRYNLYGKLLFYYIFWDRCSVEWKGPQLRTSSVWELLQEVFAGESLWYVRRYEKRNACVCLLVE